MYLLYSTITLFLLFSLSSLLAEDWTCFIDRSNGAECSGVELSGVEEREVLILPCFNSWCDLDWIGLDSPIAGLFDYLFMIVKRRGVREGRGGGYCIGCIW